MRCSHLIKWLTAWLLLPALLGASAATPLPAHAAESGGYRAVAAWDMDFLAVGTGGRVTVLSVDGAHHDLPAPISANLWDVTTADNTAWMVGDDGTVLALEGETLRPCPVDEVVNLYAAAAFDGTLFLGGGDGALYRGSGDGRWTRVPLRIRGDIVGLAAGQNRLVGVTTAGDSFSYTRETGYAVATCDDVTFRDVACDETGLAFWATGVRADGSPAVLHTVFGSIWSNRALTYMDGAPYDPSHLAVYGIAAVGRQMAAVTNDGLLILPDCVACNKLQDLGATSLLAVCCNGGVIAAVGDDFFVVFSDDDAVRQYKVTAETARQWQETGAVLIDVREREDYTARHIAGSVSVPLGELDTLLPQVVPDTETTVIFYCSKGVRSQTAATNAAAIGYARAYTLGSIDNWEGSFETAGDVNGDGKVDFGDALQLLRYAAEIITSDDIHIAVADLNGDNKVDSGDALQLLRLTSL